MLTHSLKFNKVNELLRYAAGIAEVKPKECSWDMAKNIRILKDAVEEIQEMLQKEREKFVDMDEHGKPVLYKDEKNGENRITKITDPDKDDTFARMIEQVNKDLIEIKLHRIKISSLDKEIKEGKINPIDLGGLIGYIFVETDEQKKKTGVATKEDLKIEVELPTAEEPKEDSKPMSK